MGKKVLVTGATGFIGRRLVARLVVDGADVRALVLPEESIRALESIGPVEISYGDVTDEDSVQRAIAGVSRVYHLAAVVGDWGDEALFREVNIEGTRQVLDAAARAGCERVLMVSTIAVYGWQLHTDTCHEDTPRQYGVGPYSRTKRESEELALDYHAMGRVPVTVVRPGNVYGPGSEVWVDEILRLVRAGQGVLVDGGRGDAALAYVDNAVDVMVRAAASERAVGRIYNALDGAGVTWLQYVSDLARIAGVAVPRRRIPVSAARVAAAFMERTGRFFGRQRRPLLTTEAVVLLSSRQPVPIGRAVDELGYQPIPYRDAMARVADYIHGGASV
jgi:nucleoside-diphosphate-sugar epimerase